MLRTKLNLPQKWGNKIYALATMSGIDRLQWRSSQRRGARAVGLRVEDETARETEGGRANLAETRLGGKRSHKSKPVWQRQQNTMPGGDGGCNQSQWPS